MTLTLKREPATGHPLEQPEIRRAWRPSQSQLITAAIGLFAATLYTWGLSRNGMANSYYAAAVKAGATSWKAFFFGSIDPGSFITVDKPPAALWLMELSARRFGQLLAAGLTMVVAGGWWVAVVALWPAATRPYIGSTSDNSILSLVFGYNGLSRIFGNGGGGPGGGGPGGGPGGGGGNLGFGGTAGIGRLFNPALEIGRASCRERV